MNEVNKTVVNQPDVIEQQILSVQNVSKLQEYYDYYNGRMIHHGIGFALSIGAIIICSELVTRLNGDSQLLAAGGFFGSLISGFCHASRLNEDDFN